MKRKLSILVLFAEFLMITVLHVAKYKKNNRTTLLCAVPQISHPLRITATAPTIFFLPGLTNQAVIILLVSPL